MGSTSVPGLVAKPVIDLALRVPQGLALPEAAAALVTAGWSPPVEVDDHWASFLLVDGVRSAIGHLYEFAQWPRAGLRLFAQWLRDHPDDRRQYAVLKTSLVAQGVWGSDYTDAKAAFVLDVVDRASGAGPARARCWGKERPQLRSIAVTSSR